MGDILSQSTDAVSLSCLHHNAVIAVESEPCRTRVRNNRTYLVSLMNSTQKRLFILSLSAGLLSCGFDSDNTALNNPEENRGAGGPNEIFAANTDLIEPENLAHQDSIGHAELIPNPAKNAYFGDLHVHTAYSFDAYSFGTTTTPFDAYRYALGEAINHPSGYAMQLDKPLDFYAVTDHAAFLGVIRDAANTANEISKYEFATTVHGLNEPDNLGLTSFNLRVKAFSTLQDKIINGIKKGDIDQRRIDDATRNTWLDTIHAANQFYTPGAFTTFAAYEYTSRTNARGNLHRNVIFKGTEKLPAMPFSKLNSQNPEGLWDWMDSLRDAGIESLAIPHNSNGSNGQMFKLVDWAGNPLSDEYAKQRLRNEPLVEVTQVKGTSDTHPVLSPEDEWADFEIMPYRVATTLHSEPKGSYVREAYLNGLQLEARGTLNPYKFGLVGASDTHVSATSDKEESFHSKSGILDGTAMVRGSVPLSMMQTMVAKVVAPTMLKEVAGETYFSSSSFETWSASGLAAVWAEENTREAIYAAFRRKETFATTGPRIALRFFAGYEFDELLDSSKGYSSTTISHAYATGVAMGSSFGSKQAMENDAQPHFLVQAQADPDSARLQRLQIVKGYIENGKSTEQVFDIACSDGLQPNPISHRCPGNGATVSLDDCSINQQLGAGQLSTVWQDPEFNPNQDAFYYVRALENPTCRWSTWDAIRAGEKPRADLATTIQERAWSSPIWYVANLETTDAVK